MLPVLNEMPPDFLRRLIAVGQSEDFAALQKLFTDFPEKRVGHLMRQTYEFWFPIVDAVSATEAVALAKALTVAERDFPWFSGGSVSGVIWVFRRLQHKTHRQMDELADWILAHTTNGYAPFSNYGARSLAEFREFKQQDEARKAVRRQAVDGQAEVARTRATPRLFGAVRRGDAKAICALLALGARVDQVLEDSSGHTALTLAESLGDRTAVDLLKAHYFRELRAAGMCLRDIANQLKFQRERRLGLTPTHHPPTKDDEH
jgi:hypothetical protein